MGEYRKNISFIRRMVCRNHNISMRIGLCAMFISLCGLSMILCGCSQKALHEAQAVVATADSLRAEGQLYTDSVGLAEAYGTLDKWQVLYPDDYAHACYHYGRLLRSQDNPVAAIQVFINATHSRTRDYHILGRVYSNMGSISHLAGEYDLSYDMYERSAKMFLQEGDSLLYYYGVNNMAFEMAEKGDKEKAILLLSEITKSCSNNAVLAKTFETRAAACFYAQQYDSAIYYASELYQLGNTEPTGLLLRARAYSFLGVNDSAVFYAKQVLQISQDLVHLNNALYILTEDDKNKDITSVRQTAADRSDVQKLLEIRQGKLSQAVQLLEQDLDWKPDLRWAYAILGTCLLTGGILWGYIIRKKKQHKLLSQEVHKLEDIAITEKQRHEKLVQEHAEYNHNLVSQIEQTCAVFYKSQRLEQDLCWSNFNQMCDIINRQFFFIAQKLQTTYCLNDKEVRLCILVLIGISNSKQLADMLYYGESGIRNFKNRTAKKLSTNSIELRNKLLKIATGESSLTYQ